MKQTKGEPLLQEVGKLRLWNHSLQAQRFGISLSQKFIIVLALTQKM